MNAVPTIAIVLIVASILACMFRGFSYTKDSTVAKVGPIELSAKKKEDVDVPLWIGIGTIVVGGVLPVVGRRG